MNVFLDLDRTLFRTTDFDDQRWQLLQATYPGRVNVAREQPRQVEFTIKSDDMYAYDFDRHIADLGFDSDEIYELIQSSDLGDGRLEHDGSEELICWLENNNFAYAVLTFGSDRYQKLKASLCPSLDGIEIITTLRPKAEFFKSIGDEPTWMIDDRPIGDELPSNVNFIQACLEGALQGNYDDWPVITSLDQATKLLQK